MFFPLGDHRQLSTILKVFYPFCSWRNLTTRRCKKWPWRLKLGLTTHSHCCEEFLHSTEFHQHHWLPVTHSRNQKTIIQQSRGKKTKSHVSLLFISKCRRLQRFWKRGNICQCHPEPSCTALSICLCSSSNSAINLTRSQYRGILSWPLGDDTNQICSQPSPATSTAQLSPSGETQTWNPNLEKKEEILS